MKTKLISSIILLCMFSTILIYHDFKRKLHSGILKNPPPIDLNKKIGEKKEFKKQRKEWIDNMHRAAPGVDWRAIERKTRDQKNAAKLLKRRKMLAKGQLSRQSTAEQFANGLITGDWIEKGSNNLSGRMHTTEVDFGNNLIYAGSAGGNIWVCDLKGNNWHSINDFLQFDNINMVRRVPYNDGYRLIVVSSDRVAYTDNDGLTWDFAAGLDSFSNRGDIFQGVMTKDENNSIFLLADEGKGATTIYKSTDLGEKFSEIQVLDGTEERFCHIWTSHYENTNVFIIKEDELYTLSNNSPLELVTYVDVQFPIAMLENVAITGNEDASYLYIAYIVEGNAFFYRSTDNGNTWSERGTVEEGLFTKRSFCCSLLNPDLVYFGGVNAYRSETGGTEWERVNSWGEYYGDPELKLHADIPEIISFLNNEGEDLIYLSTDGGLYVSKDDCQTVKNISLEGLRISQYYSTYSYRKADTELIYAGSQDQGFQRSTWETGGLIEFEQLISGDYGQLVSGDGGTSVWGNYPGFVLYYPNGVISDNSYWWDFAEYENHLWMPPMCEHPTDPRKAYLAAGTSTTGSHLWCLTYSEFSFEADEGEFDFSEGDPYSTISAIGYSPIEKNYLYVLTNRGKFFTSSDNGNSWTKTSSFTGPEGHYFYGSSIVGSPTVKGCVYIAGSGYSNAPVYVSDDYGATFNPMSTGLPSTLVFDIDINPEGNILFAATQAGPYAYVDSLKKWVDIAGIFAPDQTYWTVEYVPILKTARFGTYGRGIWDFKIESYIPVKDQEFISQVPGDYQLNNYPNPFNATTQINYTIPTPGWVEMTIYNSLGQFIRTLVNEYKTSGHYNITWDGRNEAGSMVASGTYLYHLETKEGRILLTNKMLLLQ